MNWVAFSDMLINLDNVITIDLTENNIEMLLKGNRQIINKVLTFNNHVDAVNVFKQLSRIVTSKEGKDVQ